MTNRAFLALLDDIQEKERALLERKAELYSPEQERMHNFNRVSKSINMKPPIVALVLMMKHFVALQDWLFAYDKDRINALTLDEFRKVEEWILDIRNYLALIYAMLYETIEPEE